MKAHRGRGVLAARRGRGVLAAHRGRGVLAARRGNVALAAALMIVPLALAAGLGIDFGRAWVAQERMSQAVDAAALAAARAMGSRDPVPEARMFFDANATAAGALQVSRFTVRPSADGETMTVEAEGRIRTTFLALAGNRWATLPVRASATARRTTIAMELALVLDVTGSMAGQRITQLRLAALDLVGILYGNAQTLDTLYISVVPYATAVNFGHTRTGWLENGVADTLAFAPFRWRGCVEARDHGEDLTDTPPTIRPFRPFLYPSTRALTAAGAFGVHPINGPIFGDADWGPWPVINSPLTPDRDDPDTLNPAQQFTPANARKGPNVGCGQPIAGLTNDRRAVETIIRALQPSFRGGTMGNLGLQAGWMTISPRWQGLWGTSPWGTVTPDGLPLDHGGPRGLVRKVIVMMTDGDNQWYDYARPPAFDYTAYGRLTDGRLGTTNGAQANARINQRMAAMCEAIKADGIRIYTITIGTNGTTRDLYRNCSSGPGHYFDAPTPSDLRTAFREVGTQLGNLRLER